MGKITVPSVKRVADTINVVDKTIQKCVHIFSFVLFFCFFTNKYFVEIFWCSGVKKCNILFILTIMSKFHAKTKQKNLRCFCFTPQRSIISFVNIQNVLQGVRIQTVRFEAWVVYNAFQRPWNLIHSSSNLKKTNHQLFTILSKITKVKATL